MEHNSRPTILLTVLGNPRATKSAEEEKGSISKISVSEESSHQCYLSHIPCDICFYKKNKRSPTSKINNIISREKGNKLFLAVENRRICFLSGGIFAGLGLKSIISNLDKRIHEIKQSC